MLVAFENENHARQYKSGLLGAFANRNGELAPEKIEEKEIFIFPEKYRQVEKKFGKKLSLDSALMIQLMTYVIAHTVKGARIINMDGRKMPLNLVTMSIGEPGSGKTRISGRIFHPLNQRQDEEYYKYQKAYNEYEVDMDLYRMNRRNMSKPVPPVLACSYIGCSDFETVFNRCLRNPGGVLWHFDIYDLEQIAMGSGVSKNKTAHDILVAGYQGSIVEYKKLKSGLEQKTILPFTLSLSIIAQIGLLDKIFRPKDMDQEFFQIVTPVIFPALPFDAGFFLCKLAKEPDDGLVDYYKKLIFKLLDLNVGTDPDTGKPVFKEIGVSKEAYEHYLNWRDSFSKSCANSSLMEAIVDKIAEKVIRLAACFHYLHLADKCVIQEVENIADIEGEKPQIELIDMQRAIVFADMMINAQEQFMSLVSKPDAQENMYEEEYAFAKHYLQNKDFYNEPRSAREILDCGFVTEKSVNQFARWLKKIGFPVVNDSSHKAKKFIIREMPAV